MICRDCATAGNIFRDDPIRAAELHSACDNRCNCQHKVEGEWIDYTRVKGTD